MDAKIEKISELSKLLSVKTRMSDDLFHLFVTYIRTQKCGRRNTPYRAGRKMLQNSSSLSTLMTLENRIAAIPSTLFL